MTKEAKTPNPSTGELKNPVALWAFDTLKLYSGILFPEPNSTKTYNLPGLKFMVPDIDNSEQRYRAFALAVEVGGRLELAARGGNYFSGSSELLEQVKRTSQVNADADPIRMTLLTRAANEYCTCSPKRKPGESPCAVCQMWGFIKRMQNEPDDQEANERPKQKG
jgi:hypothetical protein